MRTVKIEFNRLDIFNTYFNEEFIQANLNRIDEYGNNWMTFKDNVENNLEADSRNNILLFIKTIIDKSPLIDYLNCDLVFEEVTALPLLLYAHVFDSSRRKICFVSDVNEI